MEKDIIIYLVDQQSAVGERIRRPVGKVDQGSVGVWVHDDDADVFIPYSSIRLIERPR